MDSLNCFIDAVRLADADVALRHYKCAIGRDVEDPEQFRRAMNSPQFEGRSSRQDGYS
jgi:hypothetical protein